MVAVGKVSAMREVETENGVAGLKNRRIGFHVGLRAGVRLNFGMLGAEEFLCALAGEVFDDVGKFATTVVPLAGITLGVLVGKDRAHGLEHGFTDEVF